MNAGKDGVSLWIEQIVQESLSEGDQFTPVRLLRSGYQYRS